MKKYILTIVALLAACTMMQAQDKKESPISFTANLQNNHLWRGLVITDKPVATVFTSLKLDKDAHWTTGFWGASAFSNDSDGTHYKEINYFVQYANNGFSIGLWDLFNTRGVEDPDVWDYDKHTSGHILDLRTSYVFPESFPLRVEADVLLFGSADTQLDDEGKQQQRYSTYVELSYPLYRSEIINVRGFLGSAFALDGDTSLYGNGKHDFDVVNMGLTLSKNLKIGDWNLPVSATTLWNPSTKIARVQLAVTIF